MAKKTQTPKNLVQQDAGSGKAGAKDRHIHRLWLLTMIPDLLPPKIPQFFHPPASA